MINTDAFSLKLRASSIDKPARKLLLTNFRNTEQEQDIHAPLNADGLGRIRHFRRTAKGEWPPNPLPIDPAMEFLRLPPANTLRAQVFQNAACNWRCWYCYVPFQLLSANPATSEWVTSEQLVELYRNIPPDERPPMIDLSGGQPDLVPEWIPWMMQALRDGGLEGSVYLWSDDNLSNDYFWRHLSGPDHELISTFKGYGRVCCFKGFNETSFAFNTKAEACRFYDQFTLFKRLLETGIDLYAYATFTSLQHTNIIEDMKCFVDRLQNIHPMLPLRTIPLEIQLFSAMNGRLHSAEQSLALAGQKIAIGAWQAELEKRFSPSDRARSVIDIQLRSAGATNE